jgi:hypothetical protein
VAKSAAEKKAEAELLRRKEESQAKAAERGNGPTFKQMFFMNRLLLQKAGLPESTWGKDVRLDRDDVSAIIDYLLDDLGLKDNTDKAAA